jgi:hypothetical protein
MFLVGSLASGTHDAYSDIDFVLIPELEGATSLLEERLEWPAQFGEVVLQLDSSWNVWAGAAQVLTLLDGDLPLWLDMDIWPLPLAGIPREARILFGDPPAPVDKSLSELATELKQSAGVGQVASENVEGVLDAAWVAWHLKGIARGKGSSLEVVLRSLERPWSGDLERARKPLRRYADHVASALQRAD